MRKLFSLTTAALALTSALALVGCDSSNDQSAAFVMNFHNYAPHVGQHFKLRVVDTATGQERGRVEMHVTSSEFTVTVPYAMFPNRRYTIDWYADLNGNEAYNAPPVDHAWRWNVTFTAPNNTFDHAHDTAWTDIDFPD